MTRNTYRIQDTTIDSVDLKCLVVGRGVKVDRSVYKKYSKSRRLDVNPLTCNCMIFSDGTIAQLTDMGFHLKYLSGILSWDNLKLLRYASELTTPFSVRLIDDQAALCYENDVLDFVSFPPPTDFYRQRTAAGLPFAGNAVLQGLDWAAFQCLWPCEFAYAGKPCEFCFSGGDFETLARKGKPPPAAVSPEDLAEIVRYAVSETGANSLQITGGSTADGRAEAEHIIAYLETLQTGGLVSAQAKRGAELHEALLYITPPRELSLIDRYFTLGATRIACSIEIWDTELAAKVTPGKMSIVGRKRYVDTLTYAAAKYGPAKAFTNFIIGPEPIASLRAGAEEMCRRDVLPTAAVWMPMGRPVLGIMRPPDVDYYRRVKELFANLYVKYGLMPPASRGLNVCIESDIWAYAHE
ncbi:MAG: hypothetical protein LBS85_05340 [Clostridiales Family XIII bacterium]|nr:hypothetical protein [Clostridiales Family XIII bacterium]